MCHKTFMQAAQVEEYVSNPLTKQLYEIMFVDWTRNTIYLKTVDFVKASVLVQQQQEGGNGKIE